MSKWLGMVKKHVDALEQSVETVEDQRRFLSTLSRVVSVFGKYSGFEKIELEVGDGRPHLHVDLGSMTTEERINFIRSLEDETIQGPITDDEWDAVRKHVWMSDSADG